MDILASGDNGYYAYSRVGIAERKSEFDTELFMKLLSTQLTHQDPFEPMSNSELYDNISKMANVDSMDKMAQQLSAMNDYMDTMNAVSMVGKQVVAAKYETGDIVSGKVQSVSRTDGAYFVTIKDDISGELVRSTVGSIREIH